MSSSARLAPTPPPAATAAPAPRQISPFPYSEVLIPLNHDRAGRLSSEACSPEGEVGLAASRAAQGEAQARALGRQQGEAEARAKFEEQLTRERAAVAAALGEFARGRAAFYRKVEEEVVRLALNIARKVLHREAQLDPLLLMAIVRVALEKIEGATGVVLAVHPERVLEWRRYLSSQMDPAHLPEIVEDRALGLERCELRTSMGVAELGLDVQFKEIEQGLMDLLGARPGEKS